MRSFYTPVDRRSRQAMEAFLENHFRYDTMNSWNRSTSYACNMKIYNLGLERDIENKLYQMLEVDEFHDQLRNLMNEFGESHNYLWQAGMNGRSGGYLVLYQGRLEPSGYESYCSECGQLNYRKSSEDNCRCGACGSNSRHNFPQTHMRVTAYPGRGTDMDEDFEEWSLYELRERVALVQDFRQLADRLVREAIYMAQHCEIEEETYMVPHTRMVFV